ncbi:MAG: hypothetical protein FWF70_03445 [Bacteroidetes bacterium]|nr:hypothetical protein [Bacteroidota bacterium]MCL1968606.1 hypothetical protein [Bacteroidota bacterium]
MKKILVLALLILGSCWLANAQESVTKEDVLKLYHAAQKAERENRNEDALEIYKQLLILDPTFPISASASKDKTEPPALLNNVSSNSEKLKTIFTTPTTLTSVYSSLETFEAQPGDIFEGEMKNGMVIQGKVIRNGEPVKLFREKINNY